MREEIFMTEELWYDPVNDQVEFVIYKDGDCFEIHTWYTPYPLKFPLPIEPFMRARGLVKL